MLRSLRSLFYCAVLLVPVLGCEVEDDHREHGTATGATCPTTGSTLNYQNFGQGFMTAYCTRCHSSALTGASRQSAPSGLDFDTVNGVRANRDLIDLHAAAGPDAVNSAMPPSAPTPTDADRRRLGEWLACGAP
jgi:uncharacterized membrane protein